MPAPTFTPAPTAPTRGDPTTFNARVAAFLAWIVTWLSELNTAIPWFEEQAESVETAAAEIVGAAAVAADAAGLVARSTSTIAVSAGTKTVHFTSAKPNLAVATKQVVIVNIADASIKMFGNIATTDSSDDVTVTVTSGGVFGSGSYSNWLIIDAAFFASGATAAEVWAGTSDAAPHTPKALADAAAFQTLTDASTIAWDTATQGVNAIVTLGGNRTMGAPTNLKDGVTYTLNVKQDATGSRTVSWNAIWDFGAAGTPVLSTGAGKVDKVVGQYSSASGKIEAGFRKAA